LAEETEFSESEMSDYLAESEDEEEPDYERYDDRSIGDALASNNFKSSYANNWGSMPPSNPQVFEFSENTGPITHFAKEKDAFSAIISDKMVNM
jgi:hypothetical protein